MRGFLSFDLQKSLKFQALVILQPEFYDRARQDCSDLGAHFPGNVQIIF